MMENTAVHQEVLGGGVTAILEAHQEAGDESLTPIAAERLFSRDRQVSKSSIQAHLQQLAQSEQEANAIEEAQVEDGDLPPVEKRSYFSIGFLYIFYNIAFTMTIPALPALMLHLTNDDSSRSSYLYGLSAFVRYIIEFFCAPMLGSMEDLYGRKIMLFLSFVICSMEFILLSFFPSIPMIFLTRAMAGSLDSALPTCYTIVTDIAVYNRDNVTRKFGMLGAMSGVGYILGPVVGGYLCSISIQLCFLIATGCTVAGSLLTLCMFEETVHLNANNNKKNKNEKKDKYEQDAEETENEIEREKESNSKCRCVRFADFNPIPALVIHFSNPELRELTVPVAISSLTLGISFIWYIFMDYRFHASSTEIGYYLAFYGLVNVIVQGFCIKRLIPKYVSEMQAAVYGSVLQGIQVVCYGLSWEQWMLYVFAFLLSIGNISDPALKALIVKESLRQPNGALYQGNLQGVLCSLRTLGSAFGGLLFSSLFAFCVDQHPAMPYVPFLFSGCLYITSAIYLNNVFRKSNKWSYASSEGEDTVILFSQVSQEDTFEDDPRDMLKKHLLDEK
jgi:DHA1 family tetracycline resistance protein-like MFS transporter